MDRNKIYYNEVIVLKYVPGYVNLLVVFSIFKKTVIFKLYRGYISRSTSCDPLKKYHSTALISFLRKALYFLLNISKYTLSREDQAPSSVDQLTAPYITSSQLQFPSANLEQSIPRALNSIGDLQLVNNTASSPAHLHKS